MKNQVKIKKVGKHQQIINLFNLLNLTGIIPSKINKSYSSGLALVKFYVTYIEFVTIKNNNPIVLERISYFQKGFIMSEYYINKITNAIKSQHTVIDSDKPEVLAFLNANSNGIMVDVNHLGDTVLADSVLNNLKILSYLNDNDITYNIIAEPFNPAFEGVSN
jgi:hypothetical protein